MKTKIIILTLAALLFVSPGCTTTNPTTGEKEFDPVATALVLAPLQESASVGIMVAAKNDKNTASALRITESILTAMLESGKRTDRFEIQSRLADVIVTGLNPADSRLIIESATNLVLNYFDILANQLIRQGIDSDAALKMVATSIRDAIRDGVTRAAIVRPS